MDAPSQTPERSDELADLRRRAYGPDADIHDDRAAVARLHELEARERDQPQSPAHSQPPRHGERSATANPSNATEHPTDQPATSSSEPSVVPPSQPWWRRTPVWVIASATAVIGLVLGAAGAASVLTPDAPDYTLRPLSTQGDRGADWNSVVGSWGMDPGSEEPYEAFGGVDVWTITDERGARCIMLTRLGDPMWSQCAPTGLETILDYTVFPGETALERSLPVGTVVRFVAKDDVIEVWVAIPDESEASS